VKLDDVGPAPGGHRRRQRRLPSPRWGLGGLVARLGEGSRGERGKGKKKSSRGRAYCRRCSVFWALVGRIRWCIWARRAHTLRCNRGFDKPI
jgi:hypothetical protein